MRWKFRIEKDGSDLVFFCGVFVFLRKKRASRPARFLFFNFFVDLFGDAFIHPLIRWHFLLRRHVHLLVPRDHVFCSTHALWLRFLEIHQDVLRAKF